MRMTLCDERRPHGRFFFFLSCSGNSIGRLENLNYWQRAVQLATTQLKKSDVNSCIADYLPFVPFNPVTVPLKRVIATPAAGKTLEAKPNLLCVNSKEVKRGEERRLPEDLKSKNLREKTKYSRADETFHKSMCKPDTNNLS